MPSASQMYGGGGRYLRATDLQPQGTRRNATITDAEPRVIPDQKTQQNKDMLSLTLANAAGQPWPKEVLLNKTNMMQLVGAFGDDYAQWVGKTIQIWCEPVQGPQGITLGIKILGNNKPRPSAAATVGLPPVIGDGDAEEEAPADDTLDDVIPF